MTYDEADNLIRIFSQPVAGSSQVSNTTTYDYDLLNRRVQATDARGWPAYYQYDLVGNRTAIIDRTGKRRDFGYDALNRLTSETWRASADPNSTVVGTVSYTYNPLSKVTGASNANGSYTITYDGLGRATTVAGPYSSTLTYTYDQLDHRVQVADSFGGGTTVSSYDLAGRLTTRTTSSPQGNSVQVSWAYDVTDQLTSMTYKEEVESSWQTRATTSYSYNDSGKLSQIRTVNGSNVAVEQLDYQYDINGNVKQQDRTANPDVNAPGIADAFSSNVGLFNLTSNLSYDANGQLIAANGNTISYDGLGNREGVGWQINLGNRLDYDVRYGYGYDDEGNLTSKRDLNSGETWQYTYDNANRLIEVRHYLSNPSASPAPPVQDQLDFQYDAFGNRIERTETVRNKDGSTSATTTRYAYDGQNVYADLSGSAVSVRYVRADETDSLAARMDSVNGVVWYLTDRLGSAVTLLNSQGQAVRRQAYDPLTQQVTTISISTLQDRYSTGGREEEPKAGLRYERGRWYDANVGRWVNEDSEGFANGDINQYRYS